MKRKKQLNAAEVARVIADLAATKANDPKLPPEVRAVAAEIHAMWIEHCSKLGLGFVFKDD